MSGLWLAAPTGCRGVRLVAVVIGKRHPAARCSAVGAYVRRSGISLCEPAGADREVPLGAGDLDGVWREVLNVCVW